MNEEDKIHELFAQLTKQKPFLSMEELKQQVANEKPGRQPKLIFDILHRYPASYIQASVVVCILAGCLFVAGIKMKVFDQQPLAHVEKTAKAAGTDSKNAGGDDHVRTNLPMLKPKSDSVMPGQPKAALDPTSFPVRLASWIPERIAPPKIFELDSAELMPLGVQYHPAGEIELYTSYANIRLTRQNNVPGVSTYSILGARRLKNGHVRPPVSADIVTTETGEKVLYLSDENSQELSLENAIPIKMRLNTEGVHPTHDAPQYYILWYEYSEALLSLLPDRIRNEIREDRERMKSRNRLRENTLFVDIKLSSDSKNVMIDYKNPDHNTCAFSIYTIQGARMESITADTTCRKNICTDSMPLGKIHPGMYLFAAATDRGGSVLSWVYIQ
jgi:hypothetical protein